MICNVLGASRLAYGISRSVLLRSTAKCWFAAKQRAASKHSKVLLRSTAKCCFAAQLRAATQHSAACRICAAPNCGALRRNFALACNAALHAALLRYAQHAAAQHSTAKLPNLEDFVVVVE